MGMSVELACIFFFMFICFVSPFLRKESLCTINKSVRCVPSAYGVIPHPAAWPNRRKMDFDAHCYYVLLKRTVLLTLVVLPFYLLFSLLCFASFLPARRQIRKLRLLEDFDASTLPLHLGGTMDAYPPAQPPIMLLCSGLNVREGEERGGRN